MTFKLDDVNQRTHEFLGTLDELVQCWGTYFYEQDGSLKVTLHTSVYGKVYSDELLKTVAFKLIEHLADNEADEENPALKASDDAYDDWSAD